MLYLVNCCIWIEELISGTDLPDRTEMGMLGDHDVNGVGWQPCRCGAKTALACVDPVTFCWQTSLHAAGLHCSSDTVFAKFALQT